MMSKLYKKPSVRTGNWYRASDIYTAKDGQDVFIAVHSVDSTWQDHYRIYKDGKPYGRKTYFGESAYDSVIRECGDLLDWRANLWYDGLYTLPKENVRDWR